MKKIFLVFISFIFLFSAYGNAEEKLSIEKQLVGVVGAISGTVKTETRELKAGDKIYLNETIYAGVGAGTQILLLDQSTFTVGEDSEVVMDTFVFDPKTNDGKIVASVKQGSLKVISGLISKKNPDSLTVKVPEGTLGSRGTEFQTIVSKGKTDTLLIGPGKNNTLGMRPGAVLVGNSLGQTLLDNPYSMTSMTKGKAPGQAKKITKNQLKKFNKKMKAMRVAKLSPDEKKVKRKALKKELKKELKSMSNVKTFVPSVLNAKLSSVSVKVRTPTKVLVENSFAVLKSNLPSLPLSDIIKNFLPLSATCMLRNLEPISDPDKVPGLKASITSQLISPLSLLLDETSKALLSLFIERLPLLRSASCS